MKLAKSGRAREKAPFKGEGRKKGVGRGRSGLEGLKRGCQP